MLKNYLRIFRLLKKVSDICLIASLLVVIILLILPVLKINAQMGELEKVAEEGGIKSETDITVIIGRIIRIILSFLGLILVILILYAGFLWMTSGGNEEKIIKAKKIIAAGIIGLGIIVLSYTIASFVLARLGEIGK